MADDADQFITFHATTPFGHGAMASSISSLVENGANAVDPFDFSVYMDQVSSLSISLSFGGTRHSCALL